MSPQRSPISDVTAHPFTPSPVPHATPPADYGDPRLPQRFWDKVYPCPITGCWLWGAAHSTNGYGKFMLPNGSRAVPGSRRIGYSHRVAYSALVGPIEQILDHLCRQRSCCNPLHLEDVSHQVNLLRGETLNAEQVRRTHCPRGHPLAGANLYITPGTNKRDCLTCRHERTRRHYLGHRDPRFEHADLIDLTSEGPDDV